MVQAFVLIQAGVGMASRVGQAVSAIQGVRSTDIVTGPYDVVVRVEAASIDALGRLVVSKDPGDRGDNPDPDLPRRAPLTAASSGRTAALTPDPKHICLRECPFRTETMASGAPFRRACAEVRFSR